MAEFFLKTARLRHFGKHQGFRGGDCSAKPDVTDSDRAFSSRIGGKVWFLYSLPDPVPSFLTGTVFIIMA